MLAPQEHASFRRRMPGPASTSLSTGSNHSQEYRGSRPRSLSGMGRIFCMARATTIRRFLLLSAFFWMIMLVMFPMNFQRSRYDPVFRYPKPPSSVHDKDVPELQYTIDLELVPTAQIPMATRDFSNERIWIKENDNSLRESTISMEAFREYGEEIRLLLQMGREALMS